MSTPNLSVINGSKLKQCTCGEWFVPSRSDKKHCTDKCRLDAHLKKRNQELRAELICLFGEIEKRVFEVRDAVLERYKLHPFGCECAECAPDPFGNRRQS